MPQLVGSHLCTTAVAGYDSGSGCNKNNRVYLQRGEKDKLGEKKERQGQRQQHLSGRSSFLQIWCPFSMRRRSCSSLTMKAVRSVKTPQLPRQRTDTWKGFSTSGFKTASKWQSFLCLPLITLQLRGRLLPLYLCHQEGFCLFQFQLTEGRFSIEIEETHLLTNQRKYVHIH